MDRVQKASENSKERIKQCMKIMTVAVMIALVCGEIALYIQIGIPPVVSYMCHCEYNSSCFVSVLRVTTLPSIKSEWANKEI